MKLLKTKYNDYTYIQIYITEEEIEKKETQEKINNIKNKDNRIAIFVNGYKNYSKVLEKIILSEVERNNAL